MKLLRMNQFTFGVLSPGEIFFSKMVAGTKFFDLSEESATWEGSSSSSANLRSSRLSHKVIMDNKYYMSKKSG